MKKIDLLKKIEEAKIKQKAGNTLEANQIFQVLLKSNNDSFEEVTLGHTGNCHYGMSKLWMQNPF